MLRWPKKSQRIEKAHVAAALAELLASAAPDGVHALKPRSSLLRALGRACREVPGVEAHVLEADVLERATELQRVRAKARAARARAASQQNARRDREQAEALAREHFALIQDYIQRWEQGPDRYQECRIDWLVCQVEKDWDELDTDVVRNLVSALEVTVGHSLDWGVVKMAGNHVQEQRQAVRRGMSVDVLREEKARQKSAAVRRQNEIRGQAKRVLSSEVRQG